MLADHPLLPPQPVERPVMLQGWHHLAYVHWPYPPAAVARLLPPALEPDVIDGHAWVGLVPFLMHRIRPPWGPAVPYLGTFPETNVRTYVRGPDGTPGVWFHSLDISRLLPVLVAQTTYRLPYRWAEMALGHQSGRFAYRARRRWPGPTGVTSHVQITPGELIRSPGPLERFLTSRWGLFTLLRKRLAYAPVDHPAWPLCRARLDHLDDQLVQAAGYPAPRQEPLVHYSPGVEVRIGRPRLVEG